MTVEERVDSVCKWNNPGLRALVIQLLRDQIEDCAKIMREEVGEESFNDPFSREGELIRRAVSKIRARSEKGE